MKIISVINYKGGVGKTTLTSNLGAGLARLGKRVLLLDVDPQASLTFSFIQPDEWKQQIEPSKTIKNWHEAYGSGAQMLLHTLAFTPMPVEVALNGRGRSDLVSSHLDLIDLDMDLATRLGGGSLPQVRRNFQQVHDRIRADLKAIPADTYDYVLIDCPPNFNVITKNAIAASDQILIPARPDYLSTLGIQYLLRNIDRLSKDFEETAGRDGAETLLPIRPSILGVVFNMVSFYAEAPIAQHAAYMQNVRALENGPPILSTLVRNNNAGFSGIPETGVPLVLTHPTSQSASHARTDLLMLADEILALSIV